MGNSNVFLLASGSFTQRCKTPITTLTIFFIFARRISRSVIDWRTCSLYDCFLVTERWRYWCNSSSKCSGKPQCSVHSWTLCGNCWNSYSLIFLLIISWYIFFRLLFTSQMCFKSKIHVLITMTIFSDMGRRIVPIISGCDTIDYFLNNNSRIYKLVIQHMFPFYRYMVTERSIR